MFSLSQHQLNSSTSLMGHSIFYFIVTLLIGGWKKKIVENQSRSVSDTSKGVAILTELLRSKQR